MDERARVTISAVLVVAGVVLAILAGVTAQSSSAVQANGTVIDFGEYDTTWTEADVSEYSTVLEILEFACSENGYDLVLDGSGAVTSINGVGSGGTWTLYAVTSGSTGWTEVSYPYTQSPSDYTITSWTYSEDGEDRQPTVAVDYSGNSVYGYVQKYRVVSLSPTITEILCSVKASSIIVGVDSYSDYPESVVAGKSDGSIAVVGSYTSPSLELILGTNADLVVCDGSQTSHVQLADTLRGLGIDVIVTYPGEDTDQVLDNIYMIGVAIGYDLAAESVIENTQYVLETLSSIISSSGTGTVDTMVALEPDISPWVSGSGTYMDSVVVTMDGENVFSEWYGWVHITSDRIPYANPQVIIIITTEYSATQEEYDYLYNNLSAQWKLTDAWKNGNVYVICESAAEMVQRCGPRLAQTAELVAMILHPECFETQLPKIVGDDYADYLTYSKDMSYSSRG